MRVGSIKSRRIVVVIALLALIAAACTTAASPAPQTAAPPTAAPPTTGPSEAPTAAPSATPGPPVAVCELAYYTGPFAAYGSSLTADVVFPIREVINQDPPLGRTWEDYHQDIGTVGEAQAARTCLEKLNAEILVSIAHGYRTYRPFMIEWWQEKDSPLGPTVHGGVIPYNLGGKPLEPIFRGQGLDEALGMSGSLYADTIGAKKIVIFATQIEGFQAAANAAEKAAKALGIEVLARINSKAEQPSYRAEAQRIAQLNPDAVIAQAGSVESALLIKQAQEAGASLNWIGETGWIQQEFIKKLGTEPITKQKSIGYAAFSPNKTTAAWKFYQPLWDNNPSYSQFGPASDQYHFSTYDLLVQTALAVEAGGSYKASDWAPAMFEVGDPPGEVCYTYPDCLKLIREGKDIDYEGVTGPGSYTDGGVNTVNQTYTPFKPDGTPGDPVILDPKKALEIMVLISTKADCTPENPPNECKWGGG